MQRSNTTAMPASFRDPSGFLFRQDNEVYRQVNLGYREDYDQLLASGLYRELVQNKLLIEHREVDQAGPMAALAYKIIKPRQLGFISYPYEWCFSQLKDAALLTLDIQRRALQYGMTLKDASAYNVQFHLGRPLFIDTLSFERYRVGQPWVAYRQFCQHFLAPLALMSYTDIRLGQLLRVHLDGIPLDLASRLLPWRTRARFSLLAHLHLHAKSQRRYAQARPGGQVKKTRLSRAGLSGIIDSLAAAVRNLRWQPQNTEWADYYQDTNYTSSGLTHKQQLVAEFLDRSDPQTVWDLGANDGRFSRIASGKKRQTMAFDVDPAAVEKNYRAALTGHDQHILPLLADLTNPSPALGWQHRERMSMMERGPVDTVMALALIHHLAIGNNVPLAGIAEFMSQLGQHLIIEFVPKEDSQVQRLLASRQDVFPDYHREAFELEFGRYFKVEKQVVIENSTRTLYFLRRP